jgi:Bacterial type II and III secretion system protein
VPWLSDIPVLGYLFGAVDKAKKREELIIMIQPTVVANDADQLTVDNREESHTLLQPDVINAANGVVPSMSNNVPWSPNGPDAKTKIATVTTTTVSNGGTTSTTSTSAGEPYDSKGIHPRASTETSTTTTQTVVAPAPHVTAPQLEPVGPGPAAPSGPVPGQ